VLDRSQLARRRRAVRRVVLSRRRPLAALLAAAAVVAGLHELRPPPPDVVAVLTAARDLPAGTTLREQDLASVDYAAGTAPTGLAGDPVGSVLAGPVRAGEPVTDVRLVGAVPTAGGSAAAVPVRLGDAAVAALLVPGRRVDVITAGQRSDQPILLAEDAVVLAVLAEDPRVRGRLVIVSMPRGTATRVAAASLADQVAVTLRD